MHRIPVIKPIRLKSFFSIDAFERSRSYVHELNKFFFFLFGMLNKRFSIIHTLFHFYHLINTSHLTLV
jgi:hypothetical protein